MAEGNPEQATATGTQGPQAALSALGRIREAAKASASASDPRQEPGAVVPHAGICAGGAGQPAFQPQLQGIISLLVAGCLMITYLFNYS